MFKLYKIDDGGFEYYSTSKSNEFDCVEVQQKEVTSYSVLTKERFELVMSEHCVYHENGIGYDDWACYEIKDDYICVIECIDLDRDDDGLDHTAYAVVEYFYDENDSSTGLVYGLPYWLHFVKVGE